MTDQTPHIRPDMQGFLDMMAAVNGPTMAEMTLEEARASYQAMHNIADRPARALPVIRDLACPGPAGDIPLRLYDARETRDEASPVVVFYHGGGFVIGDLDTHHALCTEIAALIDLPVVAVHYARAPEAPFPAAILDCEAASRWVAGSPAELGREATGLVTIGDSAGGNATVVVGQMLGANPAAVPVVLQVPIFPLV
ncbi:MAG: esterase / lipase, partial [Porphyrobacter sp. HL-46]